MDLASRKKGENSFYLIELARKQLPEKGAALAESLKIVWDGSLDTGNRLIDVQHKYLVDIINELAEAIETGKAASSVKEILNLLKYYAEWHFEREEKCAERYQCPMAGQNKNAHCMFIEQFDSYRAEYRESGGSEDIALRMYKTLTDWLVNHIQKIDATFGPCIHAAEAGT